MLSYLLFLFLAKDGVTKVLDVLVKSLSGAVSVRKTVCKKQKKKGEKKPFMQQQRGFFFFWIGQMKRLAAALCRTLTALKKEGKKKEKRNYGILSK